MFCTRLRALRQGSSRNSTGMTVSIRSSPGVAARLVRHTAGRHPRLPRRDRRHTGRRCVDRGEAAADLFFRGRSAPCGPRASVALASSARAELLRSRARRPRFVDVDSRDPWAGTAHRADRADAPRFSRAPAAREGPGAPAKHPGCDESHPRALRASAAAAAARLSGSGAGRVGTHLHEHLAGVATAQEPDERLGRAVEPIDDVLAVLQPPLAYPATTIGEELRHAIDVVADDEAADRHTIEQHGSEVRPGGQLGGVVLRDDAAERNTRKRVDEAQHGLEHVAADVVEVHVDPVGTRLAKHGREIGDSIGHTCVEAELVQHEVTLVLRAGDAHRATAANLRELADGRADRAGGGGDHDRFAGLGLAEIVEADVRRHARHAEHAERRGDRRRLRIQPDRPERPHPRAGTLGDVVRLPAAVAEDEVSGSKRGVARLHDLADGSTDHGLAELDRGRIRLHVAHSAAHIRIQREPDRAHEDLAVLRLGHGCIGNLEIGRPGLPDGTTREQHAAVGHARDCRSPARGLQPRGRSVIVRPMTATTRLAEFVVKTSLRDCPDAVLAQTGRATLDSIGVMLAGAAEPVAQSVRAVARAEGGVGLCTVLGTSMRTAPGWAALANGAAGHAHDFDDTNFALMGHPSVPLLATTLAAAEAETADGAAVTLAYVIGFEIDAALGIALNPAHYTRG